MSLKPRLVDWHSLIQDDDEYLVTFGRRYRGPKHYARKEAFDRALTLPAIELLEQPLNGLEAVLIGVGDLNIYKDVLESSKWAPIANNLAVMFCFLDVWILVPAVFDVGVGCDGFERFAAVLESGETTVIDFSLVPMSDKEHEVAFASVDLEWLTRPGKLQDYCDETVDVRCASTGDVIGNISVTVAKTTLYIVAREAIGSTLESLERLRRETEAGIP